MRFTKVEKVPVFRRGFGARQMELLEFMNMDVMCVKVTLAPDEFKSTDSAQVSLRQSAKKAGFPIKVRVINKELYLIRTDM